MNPSPALKDRIASGIIATAATVLAERGETASMAEIAEAAGVGRATLYRYFPNREALLAGLVQAAFDDLSARIADADLASVPVREGVARVARAFVTAGGTYTAVVNLRHSRGGPGMPPLPETDRRLAEPVRALLRRGAADGTLRGDMPAEVLFEMFTALLERAISQAAVQGWGAEHASAVVTALFLDGADAPSE
ncbi:TetR/AcrR family transcriptional regulator [Nocardiopsis sediminis]|uniref:TetR/AcrR family transcriptional regulator n=1 Tax=Nocardiopsis sediminis TaxID=1778267 RepID=A0ABV8FQ16_9ACTN